MKAARTWPPPESHSPGTRVPQLLEASPALIEQNSIYSNRELGIDLVLVPYDLDGLTPNDPGDTDTGPNDLQNFPVISEARLTGANLEIDYSVDSPTPHDRRVL